MKLRMVDPNTIKIPELRVTARMSQETTEQFKHSITAEGIEDPIKCFEVDGELILSDGLHRLMEAIGQKIPKVPVTVKVGTMPDVIANNLASGHLRGKHPVSEMRRSIEALDKEYHLSIEEIVEKTHLTQAYVEKLMVLNELTPLILEALDNDQIGIGQAECLTRIKDPAVQETVFNQLLTYHWRLPQLLDYIRMVLETPSQTTAPPVVTEPAGPAKVRCQYCHGEYVPEQLASVIVCLQCSHIMFEAIAMARAAAQEDPSVNRSTDPEVR